MHVESWLTRAAAEKPSRAAIEASEGALSYADLLREARAGAQAMRERGVVRGDRVALALPAGLDFAKALHACLLLGAVAVPVDLRLRSHERERVVAGAALVVDEPLEERTSELEAASERHDLGAPAVVIHTSGTTSQPKPVELTYGNLLWSALGSAAALGLDPHERWLCALPLSHVGGLSILIRSAIYGTTAIVHERFETERALAALREERISLLSLVSTTLARLLDAGLSEPPRLRCALTGGGPVPAALVKRAHEAGVPICQTYGLTECCSQAATSPPTTDATPGAKPVDATGAGVPLFCTRVKVADDGEILLRGPTVAPGSLAPDGWLHTGDLGRIDGRGHLHVVGRKADTIVTGGENVAPAEVEAVIEAHPGVVEAAVLGRPDQRWGEAVCAIVVLAPGKKVAEDDLRAHCAGALAPFKVPKRFTLVSAPLPRTRSGKLLRRELR